eukprot:3644390-Amphidinium_carterae.1
MCHARRCRRPLQVREVKDATDSPHQTEHCTTVLSFGDQSLPPWAHRACAMPSLCERYSTAQASALCVWLRSVFDTAYLYERSRGEERAQKLSFTSSIFAVCMALSGNSMLSLLPLRQHQALCRFESQAGLQGADLLVQLLPKIITR